MTNTDWTVRVEGRVRRKETFCLEMRPNDSSTWLIRLLSDSGESCTAEMADIASSTVMEVSSSVTGKRS